MWKDRFGRGFEPVVRQTTGLLLLLLLLLFPWKPGKYNLCLKTPSFYGIYYYGNYGYELWYLLRDYYYYYYCVLQNVHLFISPHTTLYPEAIWSVSSSFCKLGNGRRKRQRTGDDPRVTLVFCYLSFLFSVNRLIRILRGIKRSCTWWQQELNHTCFFPKQNEYHCTKWKFLLGFLSSTDWPYISVILRCSRHCQLGFILGWAAGSLGLRIHHLLLARKSFHPTTHRVWAPLLLIPKNERILLIFSAEVCIPVLHLALVNLLLGIS